MMYVALVWPTSPSEDSTRTESSQGISCIETTCVSGMLLIESMTRGIRQMTMNILSRLGLDRWTFTLAYLRRRAPWDTGISPPELVDAIEGDHALPPGSALDLGCGTGTNSLYLARHGWHVTGVDFAAPAIERAREKQRRSGPLPGSVRFLHGDVTDLAGLHLDGLYTLIFDLGCLHTIPHEKRRDYADGVSRLATPGALYMLYGFLPSPDMRPRGVTPDEVRRLFVPAFTVERIVEGQDLRRRTSNWYWLRRAT